VTAWRSAVRDNYVTTLTAFQAANTSLADRVYRSRPESLADTRSLFVGGITEAIDLDSGTWRRVVDVDIACCIHLSDNAETTDDLEELADTLIEWLAANDRAHVLGAHTEQHPVRSATIEIPESGIFIPAIAITCRATIQQGRS
jgi:hypothetical protein